MPCTIHIERVEMEIIQEGGMSDAGELSGSRRPDHTVHSVISIPRMCYANQSANATSAGHEVEWVSRRDPFLFKHNFARHIRRRAVRRTEHQYNQVGRASRAAVKHNWTTGLGKKQRVRVFVHISHCKLHTPTNEFFYRRLPPLTPAATLKMQRRFKLKGFTYRL